MSIQWTLVASVLYLEIAIVTLLLIPFLRPRTWHKLFKSKFLHSIESQANLYFTVFIVILILLFLDSIREMRKYSEDLDVDHSRAVGAELNHSMKLFRAQRNFYIAGIALFLFLVIRRLVTLISSLAQLDIQSEASMKQAKSASEAAAKSMLKGGKSGDSDDVVSLKAQLKKKDEELSKAKSSEEALKKQSDNLSKEYDRLQAELKSVANKATGEAKKDR